MVTDIIKTNDITAPVLSMLTGGGCNPLNNTIISTIIYWFYAICLFIYSIISIITCFKQDSLEAFSKSYIDYIVATQIIAKSINFLVKRKKLISILDRFWNNFWPVDTINNLIEKHNRIHRIILRSVRIYQGILTCCMLQICFFPLLLGVRALPYSYWFFGYEKTILLKSPYYELMYIFYCVSLSLSYCLYLIPFDMLYIGLVGCTTVQFDMLKYKLLQLGEDENEDQALEHLKISVDHHIMLLQFVKDIENFFTVPLLKQYLDAITCMGVYIYLSQQEFHFLYVFSLMTNLSQTLFFSYFGQLIQDKSLAIADAAFENKWTNVNSRKVQLGLVLVMQRAQRMSVITAGGFIKLSFQSFVVMLKTAASFLAVLRSTKDK